MLTYRGAVMTWECDSNGHMNIMYFINKYENGGRNLFVQVGMHLDYMTKHNYGVAVIEQQVKYLQEALEDDVLYIESQIEGYSNKVITVYHEMKNGHSHETISTAVIKLVLLDKIKRKAVVIPDEIREKMDVFIQKMKNA